MEKKLEKLNVTENPKTKPLNSPVDNANEIDLLYHPTQSKIFHHSVKKLGRVVPVRTDHARVFKCDHLGEWCPALLAQKPNCFIRTKIGPLNEVYSQFVDDDQFVQMDLLRTPNMPPEILCFQRGGPREEIVFHADNVKAAIVSCGNLCPGYNDCIAELVKVLYYNYGVDEIVGIKYGFRGFNDEDCLPYERLNPKVVKGIHDTGGSILGCLPSPEWNIENILDKCVEDGINQIYAIGGDGTHIAIERIHQEIKNRKLNITIVGLPGSVEGDLGLIDRTFGQVTSIEESVKAINAARIEAKASHGIGIIKLMGSKSGYVAVNSCLATRGVDLVLIPEINYRLDKILDHLNRIYTRQHYAVIVISEGVDRSIFEEEKSTFPNINDPSLNIGNIFATYIQQYFAKKNMKVPVISNDPTYMLRSIYACTTDTIHCMIIAQNAVHGAMAGFTGFSSGMMNNRSVMIPVKIMNACSPIAVDPNGRMYERLLATTQQLQ